MRIFTCVVAAIFIAFLGTGNALADAEAGQGYFSIMGSYIDDDNDRNVDDDFKGGQFGFGYALNDWANLEGFVSVASPSSVPDQEHLGIGIDLQRVFRRGELFSPYLHVGLGYLEVDPIGAPSQDGLMYSGGAGFLLDIFKSNIALRGEWRHRIDTSSVKDLSDNLFSLGLQIPFGEGSPKFVDSDGDGVADGMDRCPNTPAGTRVDAYGCELDSDGDGVKDSIDKCPGTPKGVSVNASGCPMDSDGDGVSDDKDKCPNTVRGAKVGPDGCELDGDKDGVVDRLDECPNSAPGVQVDIKGCEIKAEIRLPGVNFETNSDRLLPGATNVLDDAVATLKKNPTITVEVAGHTDSDGAADYNEGLSTRRATTVRDYLASNGISVDRMSVRGYGESQPIADNTTRAGKAQNRRVVLRIIER
ncbi:MAG: OmpA family protein [Gammaproteobacteria bacterium]|nr:OmpA family protein [Gammaproteobacteria bacterium]NND46891.1 OmpA family protein [Woeseiaceae bacterium]